MGGGDRTTEGQPDGRRADGPTVVGRFAPAPPRQEADEDEAGREDADRIAGSGTERSRPGSIQISGGGLHSPPPGGTGRGRPVDGSDDARTEGRSPRIAAS